ncbi:MAG: hypothetical protein AAF078_08385 [Planctomycetota bacterium]
MIPSWRQRWIVVVGVLAGAFAWWQAGGWLAAVDGTPGYVLADAAVGWPAATAAIALLGVVALVLGGVAAATGQPLSGVIVIATSLTALALRGGSSMGFFWRHDLPAGYGTLLIEAFLWLAGLLAAVIGLQRIRDKLRPLPDPPEASIKAVSVSTCLSALAATAIGVALSLLLVRTTEPVQIFGGLLLSYLIAGGVCYLFTPYANPVGAIASPLLGGIAVYAWMLTSNRTHDDLIAAVYAEALPGLAVALPIHLASAGTLGAALGVGLAQGIDEARHEAVGAASARETNPPTPATPAAAARTLDA